MADQQGVRAAATSGGLSFEQAAAITDATSANPSVEQRLVREAATESISQLRQSCARVKAAADPDREGTEARIHGRRSLRRYRDGEGAEHLHVVGTRIDLAKDALGVLPAAGVDQYVTDEVGVDQRRDRLVEPPDALCEFLHAIDASRCSVADSSAATPRSANAAMWALAQSGVPFRTIVHEDGTIECWQQPTLPAWEVPKRDPHERRPRAPEWEPEELAVEIAEVTAERDDAAGADIAA